VPSRFPLIGGFGARTRPKNVTVLATKKHKKKCNKKITKAKTFSIFTFITNAKATSKQKTFSVVVQHSCLLEP